MKQEHDERERRQRQERRGDGWMFVSFVGAAYVFVGIIPVVLACTTGQAMLIIGALALYIGNLALVSHANRQW